MRRIQTLRGVLALTLAMIGLAIAGCNRCGGCREYARPAYSNGPAYGSGYYPVRYARRDYVDRRSYRGNWNNHRNRDCD